METITIQQRTIKIDGSAKTNVKWRVLKERLPRKEKKWLKKQYPLRWKFMAFGYSMKGEIK